MIFLTRVLALGLVLLLFCTGVVFASYTIVLKNGRRITVKSYREEGAMIKVRGMGGEFGIAKDQIESIIDTGRDEDKGMVVPEFSRVEPGYPSGEGDESASASKSENPSADDMTHKQAASTPSKVAEEAEYLRRIKEKTEHLKRLQEQYTVVTRGSSGAQSGLLDSKEAIKGRTADLQSRLKDAQRSRSTGAAGGAPRVNVPPPEYSAKEKELSELRKRIVQTQNERDQLIREMQQKNLDSASVSP